MVGVTALGIRLLSFRVECVPQVYMKQRVELGSFLEPIHREGTGYSTVRSHGLVFFCTRRQHCSMAQAYVAKFVVVAFVGRYYKLLPHDYDNIYL